MTAVGPWIAALGLLGALAPSDSLYNTVWSVQVASRLSQAPVCSPSCVWISCKGGVEARSYADGSRLFRLKTKGTMRLCAMGGDSVIAFHRQPRGEIVVLGACPPRVLARRRLRDPIVALDCRGDDVVYALSHGVWRFGHGRWREEAFPSPAAPGWCCVQTAVTERDTMSVLSRRSGGVVMISRGEVKPMSGEFVGGVVEAVALGDSLLLVGNEGVLALYDGARAMAWKVELPTGLQCPPVAHSRRVWAALRDRTLVLIDARDGTTLGQWRLPGPLSGPLAAHGEGVAYATFDGTVWSIAGSGHSPRKLAHLRASAVGVACSGDAMVVAVENGRLLRLDSRIRARGD